MGLQCDGLVSIHLTPDACTKYVFSELVCSIEFDNGFTATSVIHPATYLNKVLVASSQGTMQLWNIRAKYVQLTAF